jgi:hypothetical protein
MMTEKMQRFICQPTEDGMFWEVAFFDYSRDRYISIKGEKYQNEEDARQQASKFNKQQAEYDKDAERIIYK